MEEQEERIKQVLYGYEKAGLIDGDSQKVLSYLSDDVMGIGMGEQGFVRSKKEIQDIMNGTVKRDLEAFYELEFGEIVIHFAAEDAANLCTQVYVKRTYEGKVTVSGFMQSLSFVLKENTWYICLLHASPIMLSEECIESYPMTFADNTLAQLRLELQEEAFQMVNQSLSGGVLGTYQTENYPVCFANNALLEMLGYSRDEFEEMFRDGMDKLIPPEEKAHLSELEAKRKIDSEDISARMQWLKKDGSRIWVEFRSRKTKDERGNDIFLTVAIDVSEIVGLQLKAKKQTQAMLSSIRYASKIQRSVLPSDTLFETVFSDYAVRWMPKDVVGGDIYWLKKFKAGAVLCVCDCTGHGVPGALLTILITSILEAVVCEENCKNTDAILLELDRRMSAALRVKNMQEENVISRIQDGCDLALLFLSNDKNITVSSSNIHLFLCDGDEVSKIKGQRLQIGEGKLVSKEEIKITSIAANESNKFYLATDGLYDQIGGEFLLPFGYKKVKEILLKCHDEDQASMADEIWEAFEEYRGDNLRRDDVEFIAFKL